jgi:hypothetical protein
MENNLTSLLNSSGFLLQLALEASQPFPLDPNNFVLREHPWKTDEENGFVDLVITRGLVRFIIECKRPRGGQWLFPVLKGSQSNITRGTVFWIDSHPGRIDLTGVNDIHMKPQSYETDICIVRGQAEDHKPLLERIAFSLLQTTQAIGNQELPILHKYGFPEFYIYIPVIVTSAELHVCEVDPALIDISTGTIDSIKTVVVPFIRFRKTLSFDFQATQESMSLDKANKKLQSSVFVVNSNSFSEFLSSWSDNQMNRIYPWEMARRIEKNNSE